MVAARAALAAVAVAAGLALLSGGSGADPRTPAALPGMPPPFLGTAVTGDGGLAAAVDAYGDVVEMRVPGPVGAALIENPAERQAAGSVSARTGIVPRVRIGRRAALPMWRADSIRQRYLAGTSVVRTVATFGGPGLPGPVEVGITDAARGEELARVVQVEGPAGLRLTPELSIRLAAANGRVRCRQARRGRGLALVCSPPQAEGRRAPEEQPPSRRVAETDRRRRSAFAAAKSVIAAAAGNDRRWLSRARPLGPGAPPWARGMYRRSLLVLRALTDRRSGAVAAGARDGWAYVWPRDAATVALALAAAGYGKEARRVTHFLAGLDLGAAARFEGDGTPVPGRAAQGDASGWVEIAPRATGLAGAACSAPAGRAQKRRCLPERAPWRGRSDYQEGAPGDYLANAIVAMADGAGPARRRGDRVSAEFGSGRGLVRHAGDPASGLDSAAAWAVRPFAQPALFPAVRLTLLRLAGGASRFGITPGEGWPNADPWTAPTAWSAWSLAALGERRQALRLLADLRRAATPAGDLPERVDARTGIPRSTTPLAWSHAFAILALSTFWSL